MNQEYDRNDPKQSEAAWDKLADSLRPGWETEDGGHYAVRQQIGFGRPFGPRRLASDRCQSGKRNYCTCDTCF